jgi:hypothetical protein
MIQACNHQETEKPLRVYRYFTGKDDSAFCHRVTSALNQGYELYGAPTLTFDQKRGEVVCGQAVTKDVEGKDYEPGISLDGL